MTRALDHCAAMAMLAALSTQPQVSGDLILTGYDHDGLRLDLYGDRPTASGERYIITDAALTGTTVSLFSVIPTSAMISFGDHCDAELPDWIENAADARADAQAMQRLEWMGVGA